MPSTTPPAAPTPSHYRALALVLTAALAIGLARAIPRGSYASATNHPGTARDASVSPPPGDRPHIVDPNTAGLAELIALPSIGPAMARRIIAARATPFRSPADMLRVRGIGPRTLERLRPYLRFDSNDAGQGEGG